MHILPLRDGKPFENKCFSVISFLGASVWKLLQIFYTNLCAEKRAIFRFLFAIGEAFNKKLTCENVKRA